METSTKKSLLAGLLSVALLTGGGFAATSLVDLKVRLAVSETVIKAQQAIAQLQNFVPTSVDRKAGVYSILVPGKTEKDKARRFTVKVISEQ